MAAGGGSLATGLDAGHRGGTIRESMGVATMSRTTMANRHANDSAASGPPAGSRITSRHMHVPDDDDGRLSPSRKPGLGERGGPSICSTFLSDFPSAQNFQRRKRHHARPCAARLFRAACGIPYRWISQTRRCRRAAWATSSGFTPAEQSSASILNVSDTAIGLPGIRAVSITMPVGVWATRRTSRCSAITKSALG